MKTNSSFLWLRIWQNDPDPTGSKHKTNSEQTTVHQPHWNTYKLNRIVYYIQYIYCMYHVWILNQLVLYQGSGSKIFIKHTVPDDLMTILVLLRNPHLFVTFSDIWKGTVPQKQFAFQNCFRPQQWTINGLYIFSILCQNVTFCIKYLFSRCKACFIHTLLVILSL